MDAQRRHHMDLDIAVEQNVKSIEPPAQRRCNQRALLRGGDLRKCRDRSGGHWPWILSGVNHKGHEGSRSRYFHPVMACLCVPSGPLWFRFFVSTQNTFVLASHLFQSALSMLPQTGT